MNAITSEPNTDYHARREVSASMLKDMDRSWRVFEATWITGQIQREPSSSMALGTAIHAAALEPQRFATEFITDPGLDRRTKAHKDWMATVHPSMTVIRKDDMPTVVACRDALHRHPIISPLLHLEGKVERSHYFTTLPSGVPCKFRPDKVIPSVSFVLDIKTTQSVDGFDRSVADYGYHIQAAHYLAGSEEVYGGDDWQFLFAVVETNPPFRCRAVILNGESLNYGFDTRERLLDEYVRRLNDGDWSDPGEDNVITVGLPAWFYKRANV